MLTGCDEKWNAGGSGQGKFTPVVTLDDTPVNSRAEEHQSRAINVSPNDLKLTLTHHTGKKYTWSSLLDLDPEQSFPIGTYTLEASYGDKEDEGFDKPHFYGKSQQFTIRENLTSSVNVTATFGNSLVTVTCTDAFKNYFTNSSVSIKSQLGTVIEYTHSETRPVHVAPGSVEISVTGTKPNTSSPVTYKVTSFNAQAAHQYNVKVDVNNGNVGAPILEITFDDELNIEPVRIDLSQDLSNTPAPTATPYGFNNGDEVTTIAGNSPLNSLEIHLFSQGGFGVKGGVSPSVILETEGKSLEGQDWPKYIDLAKADLEQKQLLLDLGLREAGIWSNQGTMAVVDLSDVCSHIHYREGEDANNKTTFKLTVIDRLNQSIEEPITVSVEVVKRTLEISNPSVVYVDQDSCSFNITSNGPNMRDIKIQYKNQLGVFQELQIVSRSQAVESNGMYTSRFKVKGVPEDKALDLRAVVFTEEDDREIIAAEASTLVERTERPFRLIFDENDIWARKGKLTLVSDNGDAIELSKTAKLEIKAVGTGSFSTPEISKKEVNFNLSNLTPGTKYTARVQINGARSRYLEFNTESPDTLPNRHMERWTVAATGNNWERWAVDGWATYNYMSTNNTGTRNGTAYVNRSGTAQTSQAHAGQYAAELRTIGWGSGNSAYGTKTSGKRNKKT